MKRLIIISAFLALFRPSQAQTVIGNQIATKITVAAYGATQNALLSIPDDYAETSHNYGVNIYEWMLQHAKGSDPVPEPEPVKYIQIAHDPAKIPKVIILDTDEKWTEYTDSSISSGAIKISTK